jgi:hypothetical protein
VNKKKQKNFFYAGPWALSAASPWPSIKEVFAPLFSKSGRFPFPEKPAVAAFRFSRHQACVTEETE